MKVIIAFLATLVLSSCVAHVSPLLPPPYHCFRWQELNGMVYSRCYTTHRQCIRNEVRLMDNRPWVRILDGCRYIMKKDEEK